MSALLQVKIVTEDIRWKQRFENFDKAYGRFCEALQVTSTRPEDQLYQIALVGTFQFTFELAWKTLKDYLKYSGIDASLPRDVIKQAFHHNLISHGQVWIDMLETRNLMAHVYQEKSAIEAVKNIRDRFFQPIQEVHNWLQSQLGKP